MRAASTTRTHARRNAPVTVLRSTPGSRPSVGTVTCEIREGLHTRCPLNAGACRAVSWKGGAQIWHSTSVEIMNASVYCECEWLTVFNSSVETARA